MKPFIAVVTALCLLGTIVKTRQLLKKPGDRRMRDLCLMLAAMTTSIGMQLVSAPVDRITEVPMLGRLISNTAIIVAAGAGQAVLTRIYFPEHEANPTVRRQYWVLGAFLVAIVALFVITPPQPGASPARPDAAAGKPEIYTAPYLYLYFAYLAVTLTAVFRLCLKFAGQAGRTSIRVGLRIIATACVFGLLYTATKFGVLVVTWFGVDLRGFEPKYVPPLFLITDALILAGVTVQVWPPLWQWLVDNVTWWRLRPLWTVLYRASPEVALYPQDTVRRKLLGRDHGSRMYRMVIEIRDAQLTLRPFTDPRAEEIAAELARQANLGGDELKAVVEASAIASAIEVKASGRRPTSTVTAFEGGDNVEAESRQLLRVARAFRRSPIVRTTLEQLHAR